MRDKNKRWYIDSALPGLSHQFTLKILLCHTIICPVLIHVSFCFSLSSSPLPPIIAQFPSPIPCLHVYIALHSPTTFPPYPNCICISPLMNLCPTVQLILLSPRYLIHVSKTHQCSTLSTPRLMSIHCACHSYKILH